MYLIGAVFLYSVGRGGSPGDPQSNDRVLGDPPSISRFYSGLALCTSGAASLRLCALQSPVCVGASGRCLGPAFSRSLESV